MPSPNSVYISAFICEKVLKEDEAKTLSFIRTVDTYTLVAPQPTKPNEKLIFGPIEATLAILAKAESAWSGEVTFVGTNPAGQEFVRKTLPLVLTGGTHNHNFLIELLLASDQEGTYWFSLLVENETKQRVPLRIVHATNPTSSLKK